MNQTEDQDHALEIGEKVRSARKQAGLSLREMAAEIDISASMLSQIENGRSFPSVRTLYDIAALLRLPMDHFFPSLAHQQAAPRPAGLDGAQQVPLTASEARSTSGVNFADVDTSSMVLRRQARPGIALHGGVYWARLTPQSEPNVEFLEIAYEPGATSGIRLSHHSGREFGLVLEGQLTLELGFNTHLLEPGDSIMFDSEIPHRLSNASQQTVRALWIILEQGNQSASRPAAAEKGS